MPLGYRDIYDQWQRSKSFGDPRDISSFATDLNDTTGTNEYDAAVKPSWWTRASTAADVNVFEPIAKYTGLEAAGRGIGGLFGPEGAETGARIARGLPRTIAQTLPLVAGEIASGGLATPILAPLGAAATGGLFGAQTYAETGSPTAAAVSGVTAAALPTIGKYAGELGVRAFGPEAESVITKEGQRAFLPKAVTSAAGEDVTPYGGFKAAQLAGSQAGIVGGLQASSALQAHILGQPYNPLSPDFWAQQIPFSLFDLYKTGTAKLPTAESAKAPPIFPKGKDYIPPATTTTEGAVASANLSDLLDKLTGIAKDQTPGDKSKAFSDAIGAVMNPAGPTTPPDTRVILIGHPKEYDNGSVKLYGLASKGYDLPEHGNVWINNPDSATKFQNPDGSMTFIIDRKNVSSNVKYPLGPLDFPALRAKGQAPLTTAAAPTGEGVAPETDLLSLRQKFQQTVNNDTIFQAAVAKEPKDPTQAVAYWQNAIDKMTPEHLKPGYVSPFSTDEEQVIKDAGVNPATLSATETQPITPTGEVEERLVRPAVQTIDGKTFVGAIHADAWERAGSPEGGQYEDGWVTNTGRFLTKDEAAREFPTSFDPAATDEVGSSDAWRGADTAQELTPEEEAGQTPWTPDQMDETKVVKKSAQKIEVAQQQVDNSQQSLDFVPQNAEDVASTLQSTTDELESRIPSHFTPESPETVAAMPELERRIYKAQWDPKRGLMKGAPLDTETTARIKAEFVKESLVEAQKEGLSPTAAVETVRLQTETPKVDRAKQDINLEQENIRLSAKRKPATPTLPVYNEQAAERVASMESPEDALDEMKKLGVPATRAQGIWNKARSRQAGDETDWGEAFYDALNDDLNAWQKSAPLTQAELPVAKQPLQPGAPPVTPPTDVSSVVKRAIPPETRAGLLKDRGTGKPYRRATEAEAQALLDEYLKQNPDDPFAYRVMRMRGKYYIRGTPREVSLEGGPTTSLEKTIAAPPVEEAEQPVVDVEDIRDQIATEAATTKVEVPIETGAQEAEVFTPKAEDRPDLSFTDYLNQLDVASKNPIQLRNAAGFDDLPTAITAIQQFRTAITDVFSKGKEGFKAVNEALKARGILRFDSEQEMLDTFRKMRSGMEEFSGKYRSFALDSQTPHDPQLTAEIGIQHPTQGLANFLDWFIKNNPNSLIGDLAAGLRKFSDFSHVNVTNDEGKGWWWRDGNININRLPSDKADALGDWGNAVLHEISHDTLADLDTRTDPAAIEFKSKLQRILRIMRDSPRLPEELRKSIKQSLIEGWYDKGAEEYKSKYDQTMSGREYWKGVHYSLQNERELIAGIFDSPELVRLMQETKMPKSPVTVLNFFANAFARMFGYTPNAENAFAQLLSSYDNYLSGTRNSRGYNAASYIRDSLIAAGVQPQAMASRLNTVSDLYNTGDPTVSIKGFEREMKEGLLPSMTPAGPLNDDVKNAIIAGDDKAVKTAVDNLLVDQVPQHRALLDRVQQDYKISNNLYNEAQKGNLYAELSLFQEGLKKLPRVLNSMRDGLDRQDKATGRFQTLDGMSGGDGIQRMWFNSLKGDKPAIPTDQSGVEDQAREAMGIDPLSSTFISNRRRGVAETGEKPLSWIDRVFKFSSYTSQEVPGFKPIYEATHETQADAFRRMTELNMVKNSGDSKGWDKTVAAANKRVATTPGLDRIASDILRRAQVLDKMKDQTFSFDDPEVQEALNRASTAKNRKGTSDREDVITALNSEFARSQHYINSVVPEHLTRMNRILTAGAIIGREIGMPFTKAWDLAGQMMTALGKLRDPAQSPMGAEELKLIAPQMQPDTFMKVLGQTQGFITDSEKHLAVLQRYPHYVSEQRYGDYHLVMSREGEPLRESYNTEKAARARAKELQTDGWNLEDIIPKNRTNVANIYGSDPVVSSMLELDQQALNRFESLISDLPLEKQAQLRPLIERAADYTGSQAAFTPIPTQASPKRRFVPGRETIDMIDNAEQYYRRSINWMRHRETRATTAFQMLDPELLGNRPLREYSQQFVDNNLAPDNPVARRLSEATFYWNLAGNFGVDFLHSIQSLTTGMASVIRETGSTADALKYVANASAKVFKRYTTGKWADPNTEFFVNWLTARGGLGLPAWGDIFDPSTMNYFQTYGPESTYGKTLNAVKAGVRGYKGIFLRHNDMVGGLAGFQIGLDRGMSLEDAARFGEGVKDRGFYSAGKVQRSVGLWSIKEKSVPQLLSSLRTYTLGWFSQLAHNYKVGFQGAPADYTPQQIRGAKQAFAYMLGAQAVLAGGLGLPGVGQGLALLKQTTGLDLKGWTRKNLAAMFGEDQDDYGGLLTGMALHGLVSQFAPFDPSGRHIPNFPFIGVTPQKGFDIANLIPAPFSTAADMIGGLGAAAKGQDPSRAIPQIARGPLDLFQGGGDIRNSKGELLYQLSPTERVVKALGMEPSRVSAAKETAATVNEMNKAALANKAKQVDEVATLYRRGDKANAQKRLAEIQQQNPTYNMASFVKAVAGAVEKQTMPFDWKREVNPALDIEGLSSNLPSQELARLQLRHGVASDLGLRQPPGLRQSIRAASIDDLMNADPYTTRSQALQRLLTPQQLRRRNISLTPLESQSPYQEVGYQ